MASQGIVAIVMDDKVLLKVVTGEDGMKYSFVAQALRSRFRDHGMPTEEETIEIAAQWFGRASLVVVSPTRIVSAEDGDVSDEPMYERYRRTFEQWNFNPRWEEGIVEFAERIEVRSIFNQTFCLNCHAEVSPVPSVTDGWRHTFAGGCSHPLPGTRIGLWDLATLGYEKAYEKARAA